MGKDMWEVYIERKQVFISKANFPSKPKSLQIVENCNPQHDILNIKHGRSRHNREQPILKNVYFKVGVSRDCVSLSQLGFWQTSTPTCNHLLICVLTVCYSLTYAGMHAGQPRHVSSCRLKAPCQVRVSRETRSYQSGPDPFNETFLLQRTVTDMNDEKSSLSLLYFLALS